MLLSNRAKSIALPMLLCTEEDVEGNHSTSSGKVDEKQLFYIMARGISYKEAVKLIVKSKFNKIIETVQDSELKEESIMPKICAKMGIMKEVITDNSDASIADMLIKGISMGSIDTEKKIGEYKENVDKDNIKWAKDFYQFQQDNIKALKKFL